VGHVREAIRVSPSMLGAVVPGGQHDAGGLEAS
jgi:hypothetical protein